MNVPNSHLFYERFVEAARRHGAEVIDLDHGVRIARLGQGPRLAVVAGLHGDERSGPLAALRWFEDTPPGELIPDGQELWVAPLVNTLGWDAARYTWGETNLNRSFADELAPDFLKPLMRSLSDPLPALYIDLHEDSHAEAPYYFVYPPDTHDLSQRLAGAFEAGLVEWDDSKRWYGSSEVYIRAQGCVHAVTTEAPGAWTVAQRADWQLKSILWCRDNLFSFQRIADQ